MSVKTKKNLREYALKLVQSNIFISEEREEHLLKLIPEMDDAHLAELVGILEENAEEFGFFLSDVWNEELQNEFQNFINKQNKEVIKVDQALDTEKAEEELSQELKNL